MSPRAPKRTKKSPPSPAERRRYPRLPAKGLIALIAGQLVDVLEVSATGITVAKRFTVGTTPITFTLYPCSGGRLDLNAGIRATGIVVHEEENLVGLRFEPATLALVKFVAAHMP